MKSRRVVVTGLGAICPIGNDIPTIWENAVNGVSGAGPITHFDATQFKTRFACEVKEFDSKAHMGRDARKFDTDTHYGVDSAIQAITDSGERSARGSRRDGVPYVRTRGAAAVCECDRSGKRRRALRLFLSGYHRRRKRAAGAVPRCRQ